MKKTLAEEAGELTRRAMDNGGSGSLNHDFEIKTLFPEIIEGIKTEAGKGRTSYRVYLPRHLNDEPRDSLTVKAENYKKVKIARRAKTPEEKTVNRWRKELIIFGIKKGFKKIIISPTNVCDNCEGFPGISSGCKSCKGRKLKYPTLKDETKYAKYHFVEFHWLPAEKKEE